MNRFCKMMNRKLKKYRMTKKNFLILVFAITTIPNIKAQDSLQYWARKLDKVIGSSVEGYFFNNNFWTSTGRTYTKTLYGQFNGIVAGNEMKMDAIHPRIDEYNFTKGDILVEVAENHDMLARGHTLVWHSQTPSWFNNGEFTRDSLLSILKDHVTTIVTHYKGKIGEWDVVNEVVDGDGVLRESKWYNVIGPEYIDSAFVWAHRADPDALLFINDYGAEALNSKSNGIYNLVKGLLERGIPVHGVGMQAHFTVDEINFFSIEKNIERLNELGLLTNFTEVDIKIAKENFSSSSALAKQAEDYGRLLSMMLSNPMSTSFTVWGFSDNDSWIPNHTNGEYGQACPYDLIYRPKPAYYAMLDTLKAHNGIHVGINLTKTQKAFKIVPNPANENIKISSEIDFRLLNIYSLNGSLIKSYHGNNNNEPISIIDLEKGMYLIEIIDKENSRYSQKLIKN